MQPADLNLTSQVTGHQRFLFIRGLRGDADAELAQAIDELGEGMENMHGVDGNASDDAFRRGRYQYLRAEPSISSEGDIPHAGLSEADGLIRLEAETSEPLLKYEQALRGLVESQGGAVETLAGVQRPRSYTSYAMTQYAYEPALAPGPGERCPFGVVTPQNKTQEWWDMDWIHRESFFLPRYDANEELVAKGHSLAADAGISCINRRLSHAPEGYGVEGSYDFVGYFEFAEQEGSPGDTVAVSVGAGSATLYIEDNVIVAEGGADASDNAKAGSSVAIQLANLKNVVVRRNSIRTGNGGASTTGSKASNGASATTNGKNGSGATGGAGGKGGVSSANGGKGGNGGKGLFPVDGKAGGGVGGGIGDKVGEGRVGDGGGGAGGAGGNGGAGGTGTGMLDANGAFIHSVAGSGVGAGNGAGGGGGGGGAGGIGLDGGAGGGGGGGGQGGAGGSGGSGGGASIGIVLISVANAVIENNDIVSGNGGAGGTGGNGTSGGVGAPSVCSFLGCSVGRSGDGGEGGGGGSGGIGGQGGGGGGGPSYGVVVGPGVAPVIRENTITSGVGGNGGIGGAAGLGGSPGGGGGSTGGSGGCCSFLLATAGSPGTGGQGGWSFSVFDLDVNDGATPQLSGNTLTVGQGGEGRAINGIVGDQGNTNF